ncbi:CubicO group peptidase (beta-lactamase class C family) [Anseongella ginsenosidimutans]|uniref:CubicO group peptidase (Beta-lactamase class C family) n=1 Tax=Anseongella ginsenosidimutans TaxID=496056 RepID=A0A4R3KLB2_9SPHI|nr:serine hydrolase [Anseongella ginsenosidimutans]QEC53580.1 serine hydrolase [Anseongella ginsenosidimutans]TCS84650.1 CubicO group peptidase (beta-lactamase class C family) [Anseongella ginsenosidimutans]
MQYPLTFTARILLAGLFTLASASLLAQPRQDTAASLSQKLDEYLLSAAGQYRFNGAALVARRGKILLNKGYGWQDAASKAPNDTSTVFPILSITKSFTSTVILSLQEEGKLSVKDPLSKYFPDFPKGGQITLRHLLSHTSGIYNYTNDIGKEDSAIICYPVPKQRILDIFYNKRLEFKPGKQFSYNNSGFFLLGMIVEKVTGKPYEQVVRERIFEPLGMNRSGFDFIHLPEEVKARGYDRLTAEEQRPSNPWDSTVSYAAGSIYSTTNDMYKWARAVAHQELISKESWEQAFTPYRDRYGYGWWIDTLFGHRYVTHSGGGFGFMSNLMYFPEEDVTIMLFNNFGDYGQSLHQINTGLSAIMFNKRYDLWTSREIVEVPEKILKSYTGTYTLDGKAKVFITLSGRQLFAEGNSPQSIPRLPLLAQSENVFFLEEFNVTFRFAADPEEKDLQLVVHEKGQDFQWKKIK